MTVELQNTTNARLELEDAVSTFQHRLQRFQRQETTQNSTLNSLNDVETPAVSVICVFANDRSLTHIFAELSFSSSNNSRQTPPPWMMREMSTPPSVLERLSKLGKTISTKISKCLMPTKSSRTSAHSTRGPRTSLKPLFQFRGRAVLVLQAPPARLPGLVRHLGRR